MNEWHRRAMPSVSSFLHLHHGPLQIMLSCYIFMFMWWNDLLCVERDVKLYSLSVRRC